ncbi:MAG: hypothetical protein ACE5E9_13835 [Nitrospinaceae bacterium]
MSRSVLVTLAMVAVLLGIVIFFLVFSFDSLVTMAIEKYGSYATQTQVTLKSTSISLASGQGKLRGLKVENPKGFKTKTAFQVDEVSMKLDVGTLNEDTVVINEITISGPQITYEMGKKGSNLDVLEKNIGSQATGEPTGTEPPGGNISPEEKSKKLVIENLEIRGGKINVTVPGQNETMTLDLPVVHMTGIGKEEGGALPKEVAAQIIATLKRFTGDAVKTLDLGKAVTDTVKEVTGKAESLLQSNDKETQELIKKGAEKVESAVKELLGK